MAPGIWSSQRTKGVIFDGDSPLAVHNNLNLKAGESRVVMLGV